MRGQIADELVAGAHDALAINRHHGLTVPHRRMFPGAYLWDTAVITKGLAVDDAPRAAQEIVTFLTAQWTSGMLPNEAHFHGRTFRRHLHGRHPQAPEPVTTSGITQPPLILRSALVVGRHLDPDDRAAFYSRIFPGLRRLCHWAVDERVGTRGLAVVIHPYETGMDNRLDLTEAMSAHWLQDDAFGGRFRRRVGGAVIDGARRLVGDVREVPADQRSSTRDVLAAYRQTRHIRRLGYRLPAVEASGVGLLVEDVGFNAVLVDAFTCLQEMADDLPRGERQEPAIDADLTAAMSSVAEHLEDLWFEDPAGTSSGYYSRDYRSGALLLRPTVAGLLPLLSTRDGSRRARLVDALVDPGKFWSRVPVPSAPLDSEGFLPARYWRGPSWPFPVDILETGLELHGYRDVARELRRAYLRRPHAAAHAEYDNPLTGEPLGARPFSPTAALTLRFAHREGR